MENKFINPLEDAGFKILFGPKTGERNMLNFLKALLPELGITEIEYLDTEQMGLSAEEGKSIFDLSVKTGDGSRVIVEMQKTNLRYFNYRSVYYSSHAVQVQAARDRDRQRRELGLRHLEPYWNYWFPPVYFIGVLVSGMGGTTREPSASDEDSPLYVREFRLRDKNSGEDMNVELNFIYLSLDRFGKSAEEARNPVDRFIYSLKNMWGLDEMPQSFGDSEAMVEFYEKSILANLPVETRHEIEVHKNMTTRNDILVAIAEAREDAAHEGRIEGHAKGLEEGRAEGISKGIEEGRKEGASSKQIEIARNMLARGIDISIVSECTGVSIEKLRKM